eukprot:CAMPEP_0202965766 /NCGR_PEP_ID=MMETSP1396-20130829/9801_1 /ASSEMBLY_ACC=CAM_ASM_000872 /TAXON_ID= /ORGANISM="Pseudokeronopsis sp., Strain Brazil" /LENGTH=42 /DNA_ID= /DNA_START= /DNA_END= /DNA_ORIENTATION=
MDGYEATRQIKALMADHERITLKELNCSVVAVTAYDNEESIK